MSTAKEIVKVPHKRLQEVVYRTLNVSTAGANGCSVSCSIVNSFMRFVRDINAPKGVFGYTALWLARSIEKFTNQRIAFRVLNIRKSA